ncbi:hypothetical protein [Sphingomonas carotinifaciens]|uniref:hypothetical protein n=1 Tax=Sphingomonas carotinifaciens TaxID=1166323 RepID=UPI00122CD745|nr:hypothetical protein [Sphingomonas carotinifaciens]MBB4087516.1 hypothetical protein [Sphingomonas carotinifaciens]
MQITSAPISPRDALPANVVLDRELRRVRRFATMLHDRRSVMDLTAYERELEEQLGRTRAGNDKLEGMLRPLIRRDRG